MNLLRGQGVWSLLWAKGQPIQEEPWRSVTDKENPQIPQVALRFTWAHTAVISFEPPQQPLAEVGITPIL